MKPLILGGQVRNGVNPEESPGELAVRYIKETGQTLEFLAWLRKHLRIE